MKTINIFKAQPVVNKVESISIIISVEMPNLETVIEQKQLFDKEAATLCDALRGSLPGGVFDRLLTEMMKWKVSNFIIPIEPEFGSAEWFAKQKEEPF